MAARQQSQQAEQPQWAPRLDLVGAQGVFVKLAHSGEFAATQIDLLALSGLLRLDAGDQRSKVLTYG
jgi:hypothetical protein